MMIPKSKNRCLGTYPNPKNSSLLLNMSQIVSYLFSSCPSPSVQDGVLEKETRYVLLEYFDIHYMINLMLFLNVLYIYQFFLKKNFSL